MRLRRDPHLPIDGAHPYDALSDALVKRGCAPVTPESNIAAVKDAFFDLMDTTPDSVQRAAWDELRSAQNRMAVDFFLYRVDDHDEADPLDFLASVELPVHLPDFRELARVDAAAVVTTEAGPAPEVPSLDIGEVTVDLLALGSLTGDDDE
jgi:hypothetical protein